MISSKPLFNNIAIVGVGLIGGSIGLAVKKRKMAKMVYGVARHKDTITEALKKKAIDVGTSDIKEGVSNADLIVLCSPISIIVKQIKEIQGHLKPGAIVIDVGSSKTEIIHAAEEHLKNVTFVGCHPMAGSEKRGISAAKADLFEGSICFLTDHHAKISEFWQELGATPLKLDARSHDQWVAKASHLPHLLSFALFQKINIPPAMYIPLNPSFKSLARLSKSDPNLWADILLSNQQEVLGCIKEFKKDFSDAEEALLSKNRAKILQFIQKANSNSQLFSTDDK